MDASPQNSPSRKSRFRSQSGAAYRSTAPAEEPQAETEEAPMYAAEEVDAPEPPVEAETMASPSAELPPEQSPDAAETVPPELPPEESGLAAGFRLTRSTGNQSVRRKGVSGRIVALASLLCLSAGGLGGYFLHPSAAAVNNTPEGRAATERSAPIIPLAPSVLADVDAAFTANKLRQYADARRRFDVLADQHPGWPSMRLEAARTTMYEHDFAGAESVLTALQRSGTNVDVEFLTALLQMTLQAYDKSEVAFARAVALDPARGDVFFFWGESLRRQGKPQDAASKFRQALIRNQYETTEGLYQLKLWLSEIQADQEAAKDTNAKIDRDLASGHPSGPALFAAASRDIKAGRFTEAGAHIGQAQKVMEPAVFRVILQDPTFLEQNFRSELAPYYQP